MSKRIVLVGDCNQCGACCEVESEGATLRCENLEVLGPIGQPRASKCRAYQTRYDGMPIRLYDIRTGQLSEDDYICPKNSPANSQAETETILSQGIGRGCSLSVMEEDDLTCPPETSPDAMTDIGGWYNNRGQVTEGGIHENLCGTNVAGGADPDDLSGPGGLGG